MSKEFCINDIYDRNINIADLLGKPCILANTKEELNYKKKTLLNNSELYKDIKYNIEYIKKEGIVGSLDFPQNTVCNKKPLNTLFKWVYLLENNLIPKPLDLSRESTRDFLSGKRICYKTFDYAGFFGTHLIDLKYETIITGFHLNRKGKWVADVAYNKLFKNLSEKDLMNFEFIENNYLRGTPVSSYSLE